MAVTLTDTGGGVVTIVGAAGTSSTLLMLISSGKVQLILTGETWVDGGGGSSLGFNGWGGSTISNGIVASIASFNINLNDGTNIVNVRSIQNPITFAPTAGTNTLNISSNAATNTGNLNAIDQNITFSPQTGASGSFWISDQGATSGNSDVQISSTGVTGLMGPTDNRTFNYSTGGGGTFTTGRVSLSSSAFTENVTINSMPPCSTSFRVDLNSGTNNANVKVATSVWQLFGGSGTDTVTCGTAAGSAAGMDGFSSTGTVDLAGGSNVIRWDDTGSATGNKTYTITPGVNATATIACSSFATQSWKATGGTFAGGLRFDGSSIGGNTFVVAANFQDNAVIVGNGGNTNTLNLSALSGYSVVDSGGSGTVTLSNGKTITYSGIGTFVPPLSADNRFAHLTLMGST